jgi:hypothetical protein
LNLFSSGNRFFSSLLALNRLLCGFHLFLISNNFFLNLFFTTGFSVEFLLSVLPLCGNEAELRVELLALQQQQHFFS